MSDQPGAIPLGLAQQQAARQIDPEQLELMGKKAASLYGQCGTDLSEAVVEVTKEARLAPEQVKRVCEFANTSAYLNEFEKGGEVRNVTFSGGPADPGKVLRDLNDGAHPAVNHVKEAGYEPPTGHYKIAGANDHLLAGMFGVSSDLEKVAEVLSPPDHNARYEQVDEVYDLRVKLAGARDHLRSKCISSGVLFNDVRGDLCKEAEQVVAGGSSLGDVARALAPFSPNLFLLKTAMTEIGQHLSEKGHSTTDLGSSLTKTAGRSVPNPKHPLITTFTTFTKVATEHRKLETAVGLIDEQLEAVNARLKELTR
jgi:hypothetical protein